MDLQYPTLLVICVSLHFPTTKDIAWRLLQIPCFVLYFNPLNATLNPICHLLALLWAHHILRISRIRVKMSLGSWKRWYTVGGRDGGRWGEKHMTTMRMDVTSLREGKWGEILVKIRSLLVKKWANISEIIMSWSLLWLQTRRTPCVVSSNGCKLQSLQ